MAGPMNVVHAIVNRVFGNYAVIENVVELAAVNFTQALNQTQHELFMMGVSLTGAQKSNSSASTPVDSVTDTNNKSLIFGSISVANVLQPTSTAAGPALVALQTSQLVQIGIVMGIVQLCVLCSCVLVYFAVCWLIRASPHVWNTFAFVFGGAVYIAHTSMRSVRRLFQLLFTITLLLVIYFAYQTPMWFTSTLRSVFATFLSASQQQQQQ